MDNYIYLLVTINENFGTILMIDMSLMTIFWTVDLFEAFLTVNAGSPYIILTCGSIVNILGGFARVFLITNICQQVSDDAQKVVDKLDDTKQSGQEDDKLVSFIFNMLYILFLLFFRCVRYLQGNLSGTAPSLPVAILTSTKGSSHPSWPQPLLTSSFLSSSRYKMSTLIVHISVFINILIVVLYIIRQMNG